MAVSDVQAVLEFLRKNGFSEAESALKHDMIEKGDVGSLAYEKFFFPMVPPPPPVKIPASSSQRSEAPVLNHYSRSSSNSSSDDEFVSAGSSTSDRCSSDFTNPYGIRSATPSSSKASSEKLSQFGTAREYPDFDMQNDLFWYDEKDDGNFMTPAFEGPDFFGGPAEDKFIMISDEDRQHENPHNKPQELQPEIRTSYLDETSSFNIALALKNDVSEVPLMNNCHFERTNELDECLKQDSAAYAHYGFSVALCDYSHPSSKSLIDYSDLHDVGGIHYTNDESAPYKEVKSYNNSAERLSTNEWNEDFKSSDVSNKVPEKDYTLNDVNSFEVVHSGDKDLDQPNQTDVTGDDDADDDILMYNNQEDDFEVFELRIIHRKNRTGFEENKDLPIVLNTVIAGRYYITEYLGSAAFSKVVQAHDLLTGVDVCLKIIKNDKDFFDQSLDEIKLLKLVNKYDPNDEHHILRLYDYFYHQEHLFIVCELLRANLYEFQKFNQESGGEAYFTIKRLQVITRQCLEALDYLHNLGILHCDLKPENILIKNYKRSEIKVIDLGSSCFLTDNLCLYVQSRSYRAPEVILGLPYDQKIDMWSLGCILAELCSGEVLFPNHAIVMILARIIGMLGPLDLDMLERGQETNKYFTEAFDLYHINEETNQLEYVIPEESSLEHQLQVSDRGFINFVRDLLEINPQRRPTAKAALQHPWLSKLYK